MSDPNDLAAFLGMAWQHLGRGVADPRSPARTPTLATVSPEGIPEARTVVLRRAAREDAVVEVHSDTQTAKVRALEAQPFVALHIWLPKPRLQLRMTAEVTMLTGDAVLEDWSKVPEGSRISYGTEPAPGTPIASVYAYTKPSKQERFTILRCTLQEIDLLELASGHRRALFQRDTDWQGTWIAP